MNRSINYGCSTQDVFMRRVMMTVCSLILFITIGCEELPPATLSHSNVMSEKLFGDNLRGEYDWNIDRGQFKMKRRTFFEFFDKLDKEKINARIEAFQGPGIPASKPELMSDEVYAWFSRFSLDPPTLNRLMRVDAQSAPGLTAFTLDNDGKKLLTVGKDIILWDVDSGAQIKAFRNLVTNCRSVFFDFAGEDALLQNEESISKISLRDGSVVKQWKPPIGKIAFLCAAREVDVYAVVTNKLELHALSADLEIQATLTGLKLLDANVAIHPKGQWILANSQGAKIRWRLEEAGNRIDVVSNTSDANQFSTPVCGVLLDRWCDDTSFLEFNLETPSSFTGPIYLNSMIVNATAATFDGQQDWTVTLGMKRDRENGEYYFIQDIAGSECEYSTPAVIGNQKPSAVAFNRSCERIAIGYDKVVEVVSRRRWVDERGNFTIGRIVNLFTSGNFDQFDACATELRKNIVRKNAVSGEVLFSALANRVCNLLVKFEKEPPEENYAKALKEWLERESDMALLASSIRHYNIGWDARGNETSDQITRDGARIFQERTKKAIRGLSKLLKRENPPETAFGYMFYSLRNDNADFSKAEELLQQYMEQWPLDMFGHTAMCHWLLPRWHGKLGDAGAYLSAVENVLPKPYGQIVYMRTALYFSDGYTDSVEVDSEVSNQRLYKEYKALLDKHELSRRETELVLDTFAASDRNATAFRSLMEYHYYSFGMPSRASYDSIRGIAPRINKLAKELQSFKKQ